MKTTSIKLATIGALALAGSCLAAVPASAAPMLDPGLAQASGVKPEAVRWVCGPYRCWWRPNYYGGGYGFYGPRPFYGPRWGGGWHRGWRRW